MGQISDFIAKTLHLGGTQAVQNHFNQAPVASHTQPSLGTGMAQDAASTLQNRQQTLDAAIDAASR